MSREFTHSKLVPVLVLVLALGVLAATVEEGSRHLRRVLRGQMVDRDGEILYGVAQARQFSDSTTNLARRLKDPAEQLAMALDITLLKEGVIGVRLFDQRGKFVIAFPPNIKEAALAPNALADLQALRPSSRYEETANLGDVLLLPPTVDVTTNLQPLLEVNIPIHAPGESELLGSAQLIIDAHDVQRQAALLDDQLTRQALGEFLAGGVLLAAGLIWAYRRLQNANKLLHERSARLLRANHELSLAAKTGALGAVTAHLIHGLSNPLANLQEYIKGRGGSNMEDENWRDAVAAARRMQELVHEVVRVLGEGTQTDLYELSLPELSGILGAKVKTLARDLGVACEISVTSRRSISNHQANILLLILENLIHNALKVTPRGKEVRVSIRDEGKAVAFEVADQGPGFPAHLIKNPFLPCHSTQGGAGLGLAISNRLGIQLGAELKLARSSPTGSVVVLLLPPATPGAGEPGPVLSEAGDLQPGFAMMRKT